MRWRGMKTRRPGLISGFNILKINRNFTDIATGLILVGVLAMNHFIAKGSAKRVRAEAK